MRRLVHQGEGSIAPRVNRRGFLPRDGVKIFHGQTLRPRAFDSTAEKTERELADRKPIHRLAIVSTQSNIHFGEKPGQERRPKVRNMVEETRAHPLASRLPRIQSKNLPAPFC